MSQVVFQFTRSSRSATVSYDELDVFWLVSIHALLAERDFSATACHMQLLCFNSRAPRGARRLYSLILRSRKPVSIHALLAERDSMRWARCSF